MSMTPNPELTSTGLITDADVAADAAIQGTKLQYVQNGSGAVARSIQDRLRDVVSVFDFMTATQVSDVRSGTAAVDVSGAIQAAINATTGEIFFPSGTYRLNSTISWTKSYVSLRGCGDGRTTLKAAFASGDIIVCGDGSASPANCSVRDMTIDASVARTSGAAVHVRNGHSFTIDNVQLATNQFWGFQFDGGAQQFNYVLRRFEINSGQYGILIGADGSLVQDIFIENGIIDGCTAAGMLFAYVNGFYVRGIDCIRCHNGVSMAPGTGKFTNSGWFDTVLCDTSSDNGWELVTGGGTIADVTFVGCWSATSGQSSNGYGFRIDQSAGKIDGLNFVAPRIINNNAGGIYLQNARNVYVHAPQIFGNSQASSGGFHGVRVSPNVSNWSIVGGAIGLGGGLVANQMGYGILVDAGASDNYSIINVNLSGNVIGGLSDGGTGSHKTISGNVGYTTVAKGMATLPSGSSVVVVTHGLSATPVNGDVVITPLVDIGGGGAGRYWVSNITAGQFTINVNVNASSNLYFGWQARTSGA